MYVYTMEMVYRLTSLKYAQWFSDGNILQGTGAVPRDVGISERCKQGKLADVLIYVLFNSLLMLSPLSPWSLVLIQVAESTFTEVAVSRDSDISAVKIGGRCAPSFRSVFAKLVKTEFPSKKANSVLFLCWQPVRRG